MKVLIVDDERHVVDAIVLLVPWKELGISRVFTAFSVEEANELLERERPELAIVDVVIGDRLGTEILTHINQLGLHTKAIVVSGYDDYQYIRDMFVLGGTDYLLKPIEQEPLIQAVKTAMGKLGEGPKKEERAVLSDYQRNLYRSLLLMTSHEEIYGQICQVNGKMREVSFCQILYGDCFLLPVGSEGYLLELNKLMDVIRQRLESTGSGTLFPLNGSITDMVILLYGNFAPCLEFIGKKVRSFNCDKRLSLCFGCSETQPFPDGAARALKQARAGADWAGKEEKRELIPWDASRPQIRIPVNSDRENDLFSAILVGEHMDRALERWLSDVLKSGPQCRGQIKKIWEYFRYLFEKWNRILTSRYSSYEPVTLPQAGQLQLLPENGEQADEMLGRIFGDSVKAMSAKKREARNSRSRMREIADYLELNYNRKFQQAECARMFHLNKDYMSRKFKEEMGIGVVEYINRIRIEKARELLRNTDKNIQEISDEIGFADQKYFSRQFKREVGVAPTEYRGGGMGRR